MSHVLYAAHDRQAMVFSRIGLCIPTRPVTARTPPTKTGVSSFPLERLSVLELPHLPDSTGPKDPQGLPAPANQTWLFGTSNVGVFFLLLFARLGRKQVRDHSPSLKEGHSGRDLQAGVTFKEKHTLLAVRL